LVAGQVFEVTDKIETCSLAETSESMWIRGSDTHDGPNTSRTLKATVTFQISMTAAIPDGIKTWSRF
jgi:hypothetical protein